MKISVQRGYVIGVEFMQSFYNDIMFLYIKELVVRGNEGYLIVFYYFDWYFDLVQRFSE